MGILTSIDTWILKGFHGLALANGDFFTPFAKFFTAFGEKGWNFLLFCVILALFPKTRKFGVCVFGAISCSFLLSDLILEDMIARIRPFEASETIRAWWVTAGQVFEEGFSTPSGHTAAAMAGMTACWFFRNKTRKGNKLFLLLYLYPFFMAFSRCYLMAHYPSDCIFGAVVGWISAYASLFVTEVIWILMNNHPDGWLSRFAFHWSFFPWVKKLIRKAEEKTVKNI